MKIARVLIAAGAVCVAAAVPAQAAVAATAHGAESQRSSQAGFHLPFTDPNQAGWLTLCGTNLKPVTQGSINAKPFVWRVVSNVPAPAAYWIKGAKATMFAYQPREQTPAGAWSGTIMAAASLYSNRLHPMAQFTPIDEPLTYMTKQFPPIFDHLLQLRLYLGAPNRTTDPNNYAAADIQVIGNTWHLVAGGNGSCTSGKVVSEEVLVGLKGARGKPKAAGASQAGTSSPSVSSSNSSRSSANSGSGGSTGGSGTTDAANVTHTSSAGPLVAGLVGAVVIVVALLASAMVWRRRRRITG